jgi:hypothetical protein
MVSLGKALLFGALIWLVVFGTAVVIFPIHESARPLFESIMPVAIAIATVFFADRYFRSVQRDFIREGLFLGLVWMAVNVAIDVPLMLSPSPMQMTPGDYVSDIALTYLMIPIITTGIGMVRARAPVDPI